MCTKVTNYSFILNERQMVKQKKINTHTHTRTRTPSLAHTIFECRFCVVHQCLGSLLYATKKILTELAITRQTFHIDSQKLARSLIYKHNLN